MSENIDNRANEIVSEAAYIKSHETPLLVPSLILGSLPYGPQKRKLLESGSPAPFPVKACKLLSTMCSTSAPLEDALWKIIRPLQTINYEKESLCSFQVIQRMWDKMDMQYSRRGLQLQFMSWHLLLDFFQTDTSLALTPGKTSRVSGHIFKFVTMASCILETTLFVSPSVSYLHSILDVNNEEAMELELYATLILTGMEFNLIKGRFISQDVPLFSYLCKKGISPIIESIAIYAFCLMQMVFSDTFVLSLLHQSRFGAPLTSHHETLSRLANICVFLSAFIICGFKTHLDWIERHLVSVSLLDIVEDAMFADVITFLFQHHQLYFKTDESLKRDLCPCLFTISESILKSKQELLKLIFVAA